MKKEAVNPILPQNVYIPDGEPHVFGDRVYFTDSMNHYSPASSVARYAASGQREKGPLPWHQSPEEACPLPELSDAALRPGQQFMGEDRREHKV